MLLKKSFALEPGLFRSAGFSPHLLGFPPRAERGRGLSQQITEVAAIDEDLCGKAFGAIRTADLKGVESPLLAMDVLKPAVGTPLKLGLRSHPTLQNLFRCLRPVPEATHPVVVEPGRFLHRKLAKKSAPQSGLPAGEFVTIWSTDSCRTHHSPQPGSRGQQGRFCP